VRAGDEVLCSNLTFAASANAIHYVGAEPVFIDSEPHSWNMHPELLRCELNAVKQMVRLLPPSSTSTVSAVRLRKTPPEYQQQDPTQR
jgi:dTDP-4-amino-4,6-dideoxygalactose transaminase